MFSQKKILFIGTVFPQPLDTGKKVVISGLIKYFRQSFGDSHFTYACIGTIPAEHYGDKWIVQLALPSHATRMASLIVHTVFTGQLSLQEGTLYSRFLKKQVHDLIREKKPDVVVFDTIRMSQFWVPDEYAGRTVVYLEDLFSLRYRNMLDAADKSPEALRGVLGNFAKFLPASLSTLIDRSIFIKKSLLKFESKRTQQSEKREALRATSCLLLNRSESEKLKASIPSSLQITIKPLTSVATIHDEARMAGSVPLFIFLGTLTIPQNSVAIESFIKTCWFEVLENTPDAKLMIIGGGNPSSALQELVEKHCGSLEVTGFVSDIQPILAKCSAMIVPLLFGSGVKLKVIEAIAYGVPIISTPIGVEGTPLVHAKNCLIAQSLEEFPPLMRYVLAPDINKRFSLAARSVYDTEYVSDVVSSEYEAIFR